jgi:dipeptidyl aminopeptidase/acylaminoacyl peptidase
VTGGIVVDIEETDMRGMVPEDIYELTGCADPRVSPDGTRAAYVVNRIDREADEYRSAIWMAVVDGSSPPRQFTSGAKRDGSPRWSPDGERLAFVSTRDKDEPQLYVIAADGGEPRRLTDLDGGVSDPDWSPDGTRVLFAARLADPDDEEKDEKKRRPRRLTRLQFKLDSVGWTAGHRQHLFVVPADGSAEPTPLTDGDFEDGAGTWAPDGTRVVFSSARDDDWDVRLTRDLYTVAADGSAEPERLTEVEGACDLPSWSPDGTRIAYLFYPGVEDDPRHTQVAVLDLDSRQRTLLTESLDRTCGPYPDRRPPLWDGERILFAIEDHGANHVYEVAADGTSEPKLVVGGDRLIHGYDLGGGTLAHVATSPTRLSEIFVGERALTDVGRSFAEGRALVEPERFTATSEDGTEVEAWILRPADVKPGERRPVLLNIHGGPFTQYAHRFFDEFQVYATAGYVVVYSNPRGSSGYTEAWARAIRGDGTKGDGWGSVDYQDVLAVVEEACRRFDVCDPDRVGVMGGSYGGFMTSWIVGHTDRFKTAISERAVNSFVSMWGSSDYGWDLKGYFGCYFYEDPETYLRLSPLSYAPNVTTPVLILHSENDFRCPVEQGEQLFTTLRLLGKQVEFVRFPAETHELTRAGSPAHRVQRYEVVLDWLSRTL